MTKTRLKSINRKGCFSTSISVQDPAVQSLVLRPVSRRLVQKSCLLLSDGLLEGELLLGLLLDEVVSEGTGLTLSDRVVVNYPTLRLLLPLDEQFSSWDKKNQ